MITAGRELELQGTTTSSLGLGDHPQKVVIHHASLQGPDTLQVQFVLGAWRAVLLSVSLKCHSGHTCESEVPVTGAPALLCEAVIMVGMLAALANPILPHVVRHLHCLAEAGPFMSP